MPQGITRVSITGFENIIANLNREVQAIKDRTPKGLQKAANFIRRDMDTTPPLIPVLTGNMRDSWRTRIIREVATGGGKDIGIEMGFWAGYSLWVHEMFGAVNWTRPDSGPKFFEAAINRNHDTILFIIQSETRVP